MGHDRDGTPLFLIGHPYQVGTEALETGFR
jgi:hypothetical protein